MKSFIRLFHIHWIYFIIKDPGLVRIDEPLAMSTHAQILWTAILFPHNLATNRAPSCPLFGNGFLLIQAWIFGHSPDVTFTLCIDAVPDLEYVKIVSYS